MLIIYKAYCYEKTEAKNVDEIAYQELNNSVAYYKLHAAKLDLEREHWESYIKHQQNLMRLKENVYSIHCKMTIAILILVSFLVIGGFYFAFIQFQRDKSFGNNTIKISKYGFEISSSVIGLVVLFMSFLFFYLFIKDVYAVRTTPVDSLYFGNVSSAKQVKMLQNKVISREKGK